jgi:hypothetical protein
MKYYLPLIASLLFVGSDSLAQQTISGTIKNADGKQLSEAHVLDINSRQAVATDQYGQFEIAVADSGTVIRISHVGYRPILRTIEAHQTNLMVVMNEESTLLNLVEVSGSGKTVVNGKRGIVLRDFSFADGNVLLMAENGIRYLVACDEGWKEISRLRVDKKGYKLYDDCLGNVHLFGEDSVYQINVDEGQIGLNHVFDRGYFLEQMAHCSTSSSSHIFFSSYQKAGQEVYHYGFNRETKKGTILQRVYDHQGLQDITGYFANLVANPWPYRTRVRQAGAAFGYPRLYQQMVCGNTVGLSNYANQNYSSHYPNSYRYIGTPANRERSTLLWGGRYNPYLYGRSESGYYRSVSDRALEQQFALLNTWSPSPRDRGWIDLLSQPTYSPMFNLRDSIYVFDHVVGVCYVHDSEGNEARSFPLEHQEHKGWRNLLIPDANGEKVYAHVKLRNKIYLMEVDLDNGKLVSAASLKDALFVEHLKIKDGYAYYLKEFRDVYSPDRMMRQKL